MSDGRRYEAVVVDGEGNTSTAIEGTRDRLQVADCNRQMIRILNRVLVRCHRRQEGNEAATDVTSVRANRVAGIVYGRGTIGIGGKRKVI